MSHTQRFLLGAFAAVMLAGCDPAEAAPAAPESAAIPTSSPAAEVQAAPSVAPGSPLQRGHLRGGEPVERVPEWPAPADPEAIPLAELEPGLRRSVEAIEVPVLLPTQAAWREGLVLIPLAPKGYSLRARSARSKLILQASGVARLHDLAADERADRGDPRIRGEHGRLTTNEGILSASWIERGVAYAADLECGDPSAAECSSEAGFIRLLDSLTFVAGTAAAESGVRP